MLCLHRSERADRLAEALGDVLARPLADPMVPEVVAVPTRGVERWLAQRLSHRLGTGAEPGYGVCANIEFPSPAALVERVASAACGAQAGESPWSPSRLVWPLLELVDDLMEDGDPLLAPLAAHLRATSPPGPHLRRFATVRHLAELYDHYATERPDMLLSWLNGQLPAPSWQAELWLRLRERVGSPSPPEVHAEAWARLEADPSLADLPPRLCLFGLTRLPASHLRALQALAVGRDVHLFLLYPSGALWDKLASQPARWPGHTRGRDTTGELADNPLLRSWGRDAREMQLVLAASVVSGGEHRPVPGGVPTLLGLVQDGVRSDRRPPGLPQPGAPDLRPPIGPQDDTLRVHACHGRLRQVEVLREAVLHLLAEDPTLEPRDVIVMCPDIEAYAPLVEAVFGTTGSTPGLRARLADRSLRQTNPLLAVAAHLLELAGSRVTASQVLELASRPPVSRRFELGQDELALARDWLAGSGVRWGLDGEHRRAWGLDGTEANTWRAGLDRLLLGVAMAEDGARLFGDVLPFDDVPGSNLSLVGRLAELHARLSRAIARLTGPQSAAEWVGALLSATRDLAEPSPDEAWQAEQLERTLAAVLQEAQGSAAPLDLAEARSVLADRLRGRPTRANFRTGDLTICTLVPMRAVPHRVVCLLGLDDADFPRHRVPDGDNLLLDGPKLGEPDPGSEDRQLLLDALLAATEHLVVTYQGRDPRTNQPCPPAVPLEELLDVVDQVGRPSAGDGRLRDMVVVHHPLQAFDPRNFTQGGLVPNPATAAAPAGPWGFDPVNLAGAQALIKPKGPPQRFLARPLPPVDGEVVQLEALVRFLEHPLKAFLRERLGLHLGPLTGPSLDDMPLELGSLDLWALGDRLLSAQLAGTSPGDAERAERARGLLPPSPLAEAHLDKVRPVVAALAQVARSHSAWAASPRTVPLRVPLDDGRLLTGTVGGLRAGTLVHCSYSRLGPKHRLAAWARLLALSAALPGQELAAVAIGRGPGRVGGRGLVATSTIGPLAPAEAREALRVLVDLYDRGRCEPLPLYCATSERWATTSLRGDDPFEDARACWETHYDHPGEDQDEAHVLVLGGIVSFRDLLDELPRADEHGPGWGEDRCRFGRYAHRLWAPLLGQERLVDH